MKLLRHLLPLLLLSLIGSYAIAQKKYDIQYFTVENDIVGMQRDDNTEFLWIATENGIIRFDGIHFTTFNSANTPFIKRDRIKFLGKNDKGQIFAANIGNLFLIEDNKIKPYQHNANNIIYNKENLYNKIVSFSLGEKVTPKIHSFSFDDEIIPYNQNIYLIKKKNSLIAYQTIDTATYHINLPGKNTFIFKLDEQLFSLNEHNEFGLINPADKTYKKVEVQNNSDSFLVSTKRNREIYWNQGVENAILISGTKAWILNFINNKIVPKLICSQIPTGAFIKYACYDDKDGILILATDKKSIIVIHPTYIKPVRKNRNSAANEINAYYGQVALPNGNILTNSGDIIGFHKTSNDGGIKLKEFDYNNYIIRNDKIWYTLHDSLFNYDFSQNTKEYLYRVNTGKRFVMCKNGDSIFFTDIAGIGQLYDTGLRYLYKYSIDKQENEFPSTLTELSPGLLVIGTSSGLYKYTINSNKLDTIVLTKGTVETVWKNGNYLYAGTDGDGYYIYKNGVVKQMPLDKNNYLLNIHCIVPDDHGYIWMSTNKGLFKMLKTDVIKSFDISNTQIYYHFFGKNDGMDVVGINGGCEPCALKLENDYFSFPTVNGLLWADLNAPLRLPEGNIYIDEIQVNNKKVNKDSLVYKPLAADTKDIAVTISLPAWCNTENINLQYQIYPYSTRWDLIMLRTPIIRIGNLPPGNYTLRIRKLNGFGIKNYTYKEIYFVIAKPWYKTTRFYILCVLLGMGLIYLSFRITTARYKRRQKKLQRLVDKKTNEIQESNRELAKNVQVQTRLISIISHDIITPLRFLHMVSKNLMEKKGQMNESLQDETIVEIATTANELEVLSTNILNWIKYNKEGKKLNAIAIHIHDLVEEIFTVFKIIVKRKNIQLINDTGVNDVIFQYPEPLKIVVYNLLVNAINFSENGSIKIESKREEYGILLTVADEGVGMTTDQINNILHDDYVISSENVDKKKGNGLGYLIIKDLLKLMDATIYIESKKMKGTTIRVTIPDRHSPA